MSGVTLSPISNFNSTHEPCRGLSKSLEHLCVVSSVQTRPSDQANKPLCLILWWPVYNYRNMADIDIITYKINNKEVEWWWIPRGQLVQNPPWRLSRHMRLVPSPTAFTRWFYHPFPLATFPSNYENKKMSQNTSPHHFSVVNLWKQDNTCFF